jgi:3-keto-disaccharide hydrolase
MKRLHQLLVLGIVLTVSNVRAADEEGFVSLFNGKDLSGWRGDKTYWSVEDGAITAKTTADSQLTKEKYNTFLIWEGGQPANFELRVKYRIVGGNSGVQYRSRVIDEAKFIVSGYQADIDASPKYTGMNYEEKARAFLAQRGEKATIAADGKKEIEKIGDPVELQAKVKNEDWNEYRIVATGNHLQHYVNGTLMSEVIDNQKDKAATSGVIALQAHQGFTMTVQFKDIRLKETK